MGSKRIFFCTGCGACCRWPGLVRLSDAEVDRIAAFLGLSVDDFLARYTELTPDRRNLTLIESAERHCIFLEGSNHCRIYDVRPTQCIGFPNTWTVPNQENCCRALPLPITIRPQETVVFTENREPGSEAPV